MNLDKLFPMRHVAVQTREEYWRQADRTFELITWLTVILVIVLSHTIFRGEVSFFVVYVLSITAVFFATIFYRIIPSEIKGVYWFEDKAAAIGCIDIVAVSFLIFFSGGLNSSFFFLYLVVLIAGAIVVEPKHLVFEILLTVFFILLIGFFSGQHTASIIFDRIIVIASLSLFALWVADIGRTQREAFQKINLRLERLNQLKSDFLTLMFKHIRSPLTALRWYLIHNVLTGTELSRGQKTFFYQTYEHVVRIILLVNDLRDLAYIETDVGEEEEQYKISRIDILKIIDDALAGFKAILDGRSIKLKFKKPSGSIFVEASQEPLSHVLQSLISNAVFYNRKGGGVTIQAEEISGKFQFFIKNTGLRIDEEDKEKIFTKFFRGESAKRVSPSGTGLGLYNAKAIIEKYGGRIWFESSPTEDTKFYIILTSVQ